MTSQALTALLEAYCDIRRQRDAMAKMKADLERELQTATTKLIDQMQAEHVKSLTMASGLKPTLVQVVKAKPKKDSLEAVRTWIANTVPDPDSYFEPKVIERRLNALVKTKIELEGFDPTELPPELNLQLRPTLRVGGWDANGSEDEGSET